MSNPDMGYFIIWRDKRGRPQEVVPVSQEAFQGFLRSMRELEAVWDAMMRSSRENALHWSKEI